MSKKPDDIESMFEELLLIYKKYGISKSIGFLPDKIEFILEREGIDKFELTYSEFFNYLPEHLRELAIEMTIEFLNYLYKEGIIRIKNGVKIILKGNFSIILSLIAELLMQNINIESEFDEIFNSIKKYLQTFSNFCDFQREYNLEIDKKIENKIKELEKIIQENPSIESEVKTILAKYKQNNEEKNFRN